MATDFRLGSEPHSPFLHDRRVLAMVVRMHLHITGADVDFIAFRLQTMIVRLFAIVLAFNVKLNGTIVTGRETEETVRQAFVAFLVPFQVAQNFFAFAQHLIHAQTQNIQTMEMLTQFIDAALLVVAFHERRILGQIFT